MAITLLEKKILKKSFFQKCYGCIGIYHHAYILIATVGHLLPWNSNTELEPSITCTYTEHTCKGPTRT